MERVKDYEIARIDYEINPTEQGRKELKDLLEYFLQKPMKFNPYESDNVLMTGENNFEEVCATLEENGVTEPKGLTEFEFYSKLRYYEKKYKAIENAGK